MTYTHVDPLFEVEHYYAFKGWQTTSTHADLMDAMMARDRSIHPHTRIIIVVEE